MTPMSDFKQESMAISFDSPLQRFDITRMGGKQRRKGERERVRERLVIYFKSAMCTLKQKKNPA